MMYYLLNMTLCSGLLYALYHFVLSKEKMYGFNRIYLLTAICFSLTIPLLKIPLISENPLTVQVFSREFSDQKLEENTSLISLALSALYVFVTAILFFRLVLNSIVILKSTFRYEIVPHKNSKIVLIPRLRTPYSFMNYIFLNLDEFNSNRISKDILIHETAHVNLKHSADIIFIELVQSIAWINPFFWLYNRAIRLNHEFQADEAVILQQSDRTNYQKLLLEATGLRAIYSIGSYFNFLTIKKRLIMMNKTSSPLQMALKKVLVIPIAALSLMLFSNEIAVAQTTQPGKGATPEMLAEFNTIMKNSTIKNEHGTDYKMSEKDQKRVYELINSMNDEQRKSLVLPPPPPPVVTPASSSRSIKNSN
jgi:bla regulator protein BlaR1